MQKHPPATNLDGDLHVVTENGEQCFMWRANQLTYIAQDRQELPKILATKFGPLATKLDLSYNSLSRFDNIKEFTHLNELILDNNNFQDEQLDFRKNLRLKTLSLNKNKLKNLNKLIQLVKINFPNLEYLSLIGNPLCPVSVFGCSASMHPEHDQDLLNEENEDHVGSKTRQDRDTNAQLNGHIFSSIDELVLGDFRSNRVPHSAGSRSPYSLEEANHLKYRLFIIHHLPNLRFLDSSPISAMEREEALTGCFLMGRQSVFSVERQQSPPSSLVSSAQNGHDATEFKLSIMCNDGQEIQESRSTTRQQQQSSSKGVFSRLAYKYTGKNSEGNRFIRNHDL